MNDKIKVMPLYRVTVEEMIGSDKSAYEFIFNHHCEAMDFFRAVTKLNLALDTHLHTNPVPLYWDSEEAMKYLQAVRKPHEKTGDGQ